MVYYLKLTDTEYKDIENEIISDLFKSAPLKFEKFSYLIKDELSGDKYWKFKDVQYDGVEYKAIELLDSRYSGKVRYNYGELKKHLPVEKDVKVKL